MRTFNNLEPNVWQTGRLSKEIHYGLLLRLRVVTFCRPLACGRALFVVVLFDEIEPVLIYVTTVSTFVRTGGTKLVGGGCLRSGLRVDTELFHVVGSIVQSCLSSAINQPAESAGQAC